MNKKIGILFLIPEGQESYTEVNFFEGIAKHTGFDIDIKAIGLAKAVKTRVIARNDYKLVTEFKKWLSIDSNNDMIMCFYMADGEVEKDIPAIEKTYVDTKEKLIKLLEGCNLEYWVSAMIIPEDKKFEDVIRFALNKSDSYKTGFIDFCKEKSFDYTTIDGWQEIVNYFKDTEYKDIFNAIFESIKNST